MGINNGIAFPLILPMYLPFRSRIHHAKGQSAILGHDLVSVSESIDTFDTCGSRYRESRYLKNLVSARPYWKRSALTLDPFKKYIYTATLTLTLTLTLT